MRAEINSASVFMLVSFRMTVLIAIFKKFKLLGPQTRTGQWLRFRFKFGDTVFAVYFAKESH